MENNHSEFFKKNYFVCYRIRFLPSTFFPTFQMSKIKDMCGMVGMQKLTALSQVVYLEEFFF